MAEAVRPNGWGQDSLLFRWRNALMSPEGPHATVRHLLLTLSMHMELNGESCYPGVRKIEEETGLSRRTVCSRLEEAEEGGWVTRVKRKKGKRGGTYYQYLPSIPDHVSGEGGSPVTADSGEGGSPVTGEVVKEVHRFGEGADFASQSGEPGAVSGEDPSSLVVKEVHQSSSGSRMSSKGGGSQEPFGEAPEPPPKNDELDLDELAAELTPDDRDWLVRTLQPKPLSVVAKESWPRIALSLLTDEQLKEFLAWRQEETDEANDAGREPARIPGTDEDGLF